MIAIFMIWGLYLYGDKIFGITSADTFIDISFHRIITDLKNKFFGVSYKDGNTTIRGRWYLRHFVRTSYDGHKPTFTPKWKNIILLAIAILVIVIVGISTGLWFFVLGAAFTSKANGGADQAGQTTWNEVGVPGAGDTVTISHDLFLESNTTWSDITDITGAGSLTTTDGTDWDLTITNLTNISGTLTCNDSDISLGSGVTSNSYALQVSGTFDGGSGTHIIGVFNLNNSTSVTFTSGTMTIDSRTISNSYTILFLGNPTFDHGNGTVVFTLNGTQKLYDQNNLARTFYNVIVNSTAGTLKYHNTKGFNITIANDFTITSGTFDTSETVSGTSRDLAVTNDLTIGASGILDVNNSTVTVSGDLSNSNTFTPGNSTFILDGTSQSFTGSWTFWHFTKSVASADTLTFENGETYTFGGNVTLNGASGQQLTLQSNAGGTSFAFVMSAGAVKTNLDYLTVIDSDASGSDAAHLPIAPTNSVDGGGNTDWFIPAPGGTSGGWNGFTNNHFQGFT